MGFPCDQCDMYSYVYATAGPIFLVGARTSRISSACKDQIHLETYVEGEGSHGRFDVGEEWSSDSKDTGCARLSLASPKPAASLCPVIDAELYPT